jgi:hypothetical protein
VFVAKAKLDLRPKTLDLELYAGDGVNIQLTVTDLVGAAIPIEGDISAQIRKARLDATSLAEFAADLTDSDSGIIFISLTGDQTADLVDPDEIFEGAWDVQWAPPGEEPISLMQGRVRCYVDVTR